MSGLVYEKEVVLVFHRRRGSRIRFKAGSIWAVLLQCFKSDPLPVVFTGLRWKWLLLASFAVRVSVHHLRSVKHELGTCLFHVGTGQPHVGWL